jgi:Cu(I)/Ag(I) efflux system membrane protein CusA/SilA
MVGGMATATLLTLLVIPAIFVIWKRFALPRVNAERLAGAHDAPVAEPHAVPGE